MSDNRVKKQATLVDGNTTYVATMWVYPKETNRFMRYRPQSLTVNGQPMNVSRGDIIDTIIDAPDTKWKTL